MSNQKRRVADPELVAKRLPRIIAAAIEQFGQKGFHSTTIQDIAKAAGISIGMIYQYVGDKEELLYLSVNNVVEHCVRAIEMALANAKSPLERYIAVVEALTRVQDEHHAQAVVGYRESHSMSRKHLEYIMDREREIGQVLIDCIQECIRQGIFRKINAEMLMYQSIIFAHNRALNAWRFRNAMTIEKYLYEGLSLMLKPVLENFETPLVFKARVPAVAQTKRPAARSLPTSRNRPRAVVRTD